MKTIKLFLILIFISINANAQWISLPREEFIEVGFFTDPGAMINDGGIFIGVEAQFVLEGLYIRGSISHFGGVDPDYTDWQGSIGLNLNFFNNDNIKYYLGGLAGVAYREGNPNPLIGTEGGIDFYLARKSIVLGSRLSYVHREDLKFYDSPNEELWNGYLRFAWNFNL
jgi:hypothetical protein